MNGNLLRKAEEAIQKSNFFDAEQLMLIQEKALAHDSKSVLTAYDLETSAKFFWIRGRIADHQRQYGKAVEHYKNAAECLRQIDSEDSVDFRQRNGFDWLRAARRQTCLKDAFWRSSTNGKQAYALFVHYVHDYGHLFKATAVLLFGGPLSRCKRRVAS